MPALTYAQESDLHEFIASFAENPLGFVEECYRWPIHGEAGPDAFQREFLGELGAQVRSRKFNGIDPVLPIRMGTSSGHGIGKTTLTAWLVHWILSTRTKCRGTVTANTFEQLERKTWAAVREWQQWLLHRHWFEVNAKVMFRVGFRAEWNVAPQSCAEENSEAFQGQHAIGSTSFYIFDEASAIPDSIWVAAEGGLTSGEDMIFAFGNPTRNSGLFHRIAFGDKRDRWHVQIIDSRSSKFSNKALIDEWLQDYGEDSDFFRVRVRGLPPSQDEFQFIDGARIRDAQLRVPQPLPDEPLIAGVDVSGGGSSWTVCLFRKGFDARSIKPIVLSGEQTHKNDRQLIVSKLATAIDEHGVYAMFIDAAYGEVIVDRLRRMGYTNVTAVNFGGDSADPFCQNARAFMWKSLKEWLAKGGIDQADVRLAMDLAGPGYHLNQSNKLLIESKASMVKRGVASPDRADALALTFALPVKGPSRKAVRWHAQSQSPWA